MPKYIFIRRAIKALYPAGDIVGRLAIAQAEIANEQQDMCTLHQMYTKLNKMLAEQRA